MCLYCMFCVVDDDFLGRGMQLAKKLKRDRAHTVRSKITTKGKRKVRPSNPSGEVHTCSTSENYRKTWHV